MTGEVGARTQQNSAVVDGKEIRANKSATSAAAQSNQPRKKDGLMTNVS